MSIKILEVFGFLEDGGTVVVPSRQRAAALSLAYNAAQFQRGARAWNTPDILPWQAWLAREQAGMAPGMHRALTGIEQWLLWRRVVQQAAADALQPLALADAVRRSSELLDDWGIRLRSAPTEEADLLLRARAAYAEARAAIPACDEQAWRESTTPVRRPTWLLGFSALGTAAAAAVERRGARIAVPVGDPAPDDVPGTVVTAQHVEDEFERAAAWCRAHLQQNGAARLLVVIPSLVRHASQVRRAFTEALEAAELLEGSDEQPRYALEGGVALRSYPLVDCALGLLRLQYERLQFVEFSALLRSAYLGFGGQRPRALLDQWLREQNVVSLDQAGLRRLCEARPVAAEPALRAALTRLLDQYAEATDVPRPASWWARQYAALLEAAQWPGAIGLAGAEQQVRVRFEELLGEFATLGDAAGVLSASEACGLFTSWVERAALEPASGDVPVTVTASLDDPLVSYDGIWVCGLSADVWPQPPAADAFVPFGLLQVAGVPSVSAVGQLRQARRAMQAWRRCAGELVCSWHRQREDALLEASPLLPEIAPAAGAALRVRDGLLAMGTPVESCGRDIASPWPRGPARGGARLLQDQADCPFRAMAVWRLHCAPLTAPEAGIPGRTHGQILHAALDAVWRRLGDSDGLRRQDESALQGLVVAAVNEAAARSRARLWLTLPAPLWRVEQQRCVALILALLHQEQLRSPFLVEQIEQGMDVDFGDLQLDLRLDRLDRMPGDAGMAAGTVLIDYKSGQPVRVDWEAERPGQVQLLAYASAMGDDLRALCSVHLHPKGIAWKGISDVAGRVLKLPPAEKYGRTWPQLRELWRQQVNQLGGEFVRGHAVVDPQPHACRRCHLQALCRVDATSIGEAPEAAVDENGSGDD